MLQRTAMLCLTTLLLANPSHATPDPSDWDAVLNQARGQPVYWHAWAGSSHTNAYIDWVTRRVRTEYGIALQHVKIDDTSSTVARVLAEKQAGNHRNGSIDLIWINGENFAAMREHDLLFGPFAEHLPYFALTNPSANPEVLTDFTLPTDGFESPWGKAQITFYYDSAEIDSPPHTIAELLDWAKAHPGRFTYPRIPDFTGSTFLKQALIELSADTEPLYAPVDEQQFAAITAPLWEYLDALHPHLWRSGRQFPATGPSMRALMSNGELSLAFTFHPSEAAAAVADFELPPSVRSYVLAGGTLGNVHFVAIPYNSPHQAAAMVVANFLLSPEAQAHKQDITVWGDHTVLDLSLLDAVDRQRFVQEEDNPALLPADALSHTLAEPHPTWMTRLQQAWQARYVGQ